MNFVRSLAFFGLFCSRTYVDDCYACVVYFYGEWLDREPCVSGVYVVKYQWVLDASHPYLTSVGVSW